MNGHNEVFFGKKTFIVMKLILLMAVFSIGGNCALVSRKAQKMERQRILSLNCVKESDTSGRSYENIDIDIEDCSFSRSAVYTDNGGIIAVWIEKTLQIVSCSFYECSSTQMGGAIYYSKTSATINKVCASQCSADNCHFALFQCSIGSNIQYMSINQCSKQYTGTSPIQFGSGTSVISMINISNNKANYRSCASFISITSLDASYCTFHDNRVGDSYCFFTTGTYGTFSYLNFLENNSTNDISIIYHGLTDLSMEYCIFANNEGLLFNGFFGKLTIAHCFISHSGSLVTNSVTISNNNSFTNKETYYLAQYGAAYCPTDAPPCTPALSPLETPIITPNESPLETPCETPFQTPFETPIETPIITPNESPLETPCDTPFQSPFETAIETPIITPNESPLETPCETPFQSPFETPIETPIITPNESPLETPCETPFQSPFETPIKTPFQSPFETPIETPIITPNESPLETPRETPFQSPFETLIETPFQSPFETLIETPFQSPFETPCETPFQSPFETPCETPFQSPFETPCETPFQSPFETPIETPFHSPFETPIQTLNPTINNAESENQNQGITTVLISTVGIALIAAGIFFALKYMWPSDNLTDGQNDENQDKKTTETKNEEVNSI